MHPQTRWWNSNATSGGTGLAAVCIRRPVFATMMNLLLVVLGWFPSTRSASIFSQRRTARGHGHHHPRSVAEMERRD
jgi:hypothetical protein